MNTASLTFLFDENSKTFFPIGDAFPASFYICWVLGFLDISYHST
jgi:hypothetical protein